jgi:hypothetical protein
MRNVYSDAVISRVDDAGRKAAIDILEPLCDGGCVVDRAGSADVTVAAFTVAARQLKNGTTDGAGVPAPPISDPCPGLRRTVGAARGSIGRL